MLKKNNKTTATKGFASRPYRYRFAREYANKRGAAFGGTKDLPLYSYEIDNPLSCASDIVTLPAEFMPMVREGIPEAKEMFLQIRNNGSILLPFHCERHWLTVRILPATIEVADSDFHPCHMAHVRDFATLLEEWSGTTYAISLIPVPQQPTGSAECGVHTLVNCLALGWDILSGSAGVASYAPIRPLLPQVLSETDPLRPSALVMVARALCLTNYRPLSP